MIVKTLKRSESQIVMNEWIDNSAKLPDVDSEYLKIRNDLMKFNQNVRQKYSRDYDIDIHFGVYLYDYFKNLSGFNMRAAADDGFWRYLSLKVVPNIVTERWGKDNESHFWKRGTRIWLRAIWWYVHLSWQGDIDDTLSIIESPCFTTDTILNLVERAGRKGYYTNVYRYIMYFYSRVSQEELINFNKNTKKEADSLFRILMKLNTAKTMVIDPALSLGGEREYVRSLFLDLKISV